MAEISSNSRRVAKNTLLLYVRMLLMMIIGLFTSRVVLQTLGVEDFGTYTVVYELVMLFSIVSGSISNAISRFMAFEIGKGDMTRQQKVFSSALLIQTGLAVILTILAMTAGIWYLKNCMVIPSGREDAAVWVLVCSVALLIVQLYSIPFNATIIANEDMKAFAYISILEGLLKLGVALMLILSPIDKLVAYSLMMLAVGLVVRSTYAIYCRRHCPQTRGGICYDRDIVRQMLSFSGWSFLGNGVNVLSTKGVSLLANSFFGVGVNAARGVALQVENIVKQFITNFLTALNPQITKSWASDNREYCYELVGKGCKFSVLIMMFFVIPFLYEADIILHAWLGNVPEYAAGFTRLSLIILLLDIGANSLLQLVLATGRISRYYIVTSLLTSLGFAASWAAFAMGYGPTSSYIILVAVFIVTTAAKLIYARKTAGLPVRRFIKEHIMGVKYAALISAITCLPIWYLMEEGWIRLLLVLAVSTTTLACAAYALALTPGERDFIKDSVHKIWKRKSL